VRASCLRWQAASPLISWWVDVTLVGWWVGCCEDFCVDHGGRHGRVLRDDRGDHPGVWGRRLNVISRLARAGLTVVIAAVLVFAVPIGAQAYIGPLPPTPVYIIPGAAGTAAAVGTGLEIPPVTMIAAAAVSGFMVGYGTAQALHWVWINGFTPDSTSPTYPTTGNCNVYNMGAGAVNAYAAPHNTTSIIRAYCTGLSTATTSIVLNAIGFGYFYPGTSGTWSYYTATADNYYLYAGAWYLTRTAIGAAWALSGNNYSTTGLIGSFTLPGPTLNGSTLVAPIHKIRTDVTCAGGSVITGYSVTFTEIQTVPPDIPMPSCGPGVLPTHVSVREGGADGAGGTRGLDWTAGTTTSADPLADCYPGGAAAPCVLSLLKVVPGGVVSCNEPTVDCTSYVAATSTTADYQCRWGVHIVALNQCEALQPLQLTPTIPVAPGVNPLTQISTVTVTNPDGSTTTTEIQQKPDGTFQKVVTVTSVGGTRTITTTPVDPQNNPTGTPTTVVVPPGVVAPIPGTGGMPTPTVGTVPNEGSDCWPSGVAAWNPAEWVLRPVKCALVWAFVPRTATLTTLAATAKTDLTTQGVGPIVAAVSINVAKLGSGSGCTGPTVTFAAVGITKALTPFNACSTPMSTLAQISYWVTTVVVVMGGGFAAIAAVGAGFGFNFSMRRGGGDPT
jgi:hypothetical protein